MGKGNRTDFSKLNKSVCTNFYNIPSDFDKIKNKFGYSFGLSREFYKKVFLENNAPIDQQIPGPGKYDTTIKLGKDAPKFSLYSKIDYDKYINKKNKLTPGPGDYRPISIKSDGKYPISQMKNTCAARFSKEKRFIEKSNLLFFYNLIISIFLTLLLFISLEKDNSINNLLNVSNDFNGTGKIFLSNYRSNNAISIHKKILEKQKSFQSKLNF